MSNKVIRIEKHGKPSKNVYIYKCKHIECNREIRTRHDMLNASSGYCKIHVQRKRPHESIFNSLKNDHRNLEVTLTYEEYVEFTKFEKCHYCLIKIPWIPYGVIDGKYQSKAYFLDRKDLSTGYLKDNCVVCCTRCNRARSNKFTYEEWFGMTKYFRDKNQKERDCLNGVCGV